MAEPTKILAVHYCPEDEPTDRAVATVRFRLGDRTTFGELRDTAAHYFGLEDPQHYVLENDHQARWPTDKAAWREVRGRPDAVVRMVGRSDLAADGAEEDDEEAGEEAAGVARARALAEKLAEELGDGDGARLGAGGDDEEEDDSDDEGEVIPEYVEPPLNRKRLLIEMTVHIVYTLTLILATYTKRDIKNSFDFFKAMETVFVEEELYAGATAAPPRPPAAALRGRILSGMRNLARRSGDYNEKSFLDIATFGEIWEWVEGVLKEGLFSASDEDGNAVIMLYNRMVGAVRGGHHGGGAAPARSRCCCCCASRHTRPCARPAHTSDPAPHPSHTRAGAAAAAAREARLVQPDGVGHRDDEQGPPVGDRGHLRRGVRHARERHVDGVVTSPTRPHFSHTPPRIPICTAATPSTRSPRWIPTTMGCATRRPASATARTTRASTAR